MGDYKKLESATHLSSYRLTLTLWSPTPKILQPLQAWAAGNSLPWYQDYNAVKHNRSGEFARANLLNTLDAVASLFMIVFSQFHTLAFSAHELVKKHEYWAPWIVHRNSIFWVHLSDDWNADECCGFAEAETAAGNRKFDDYPF